MKATSAHVIALAALLVAVPPAGRAAAEIDKIMRICGGKLCPVFRAPIRIPAGWREDAASGEKNDVQMLVPAGKTFETADAIIYVAVRFNRDKEPLETYVARDQDGWKKRVKDATITRLPDVAPTSGKNSFVQYRYEAPSLKSQGFERVATATDVDKDGNAFMVGVVATALTRKALEEVEEAFLSILREY